MQDEPHKRLVRCIIESDNNDGNNYERQKKWGMGRGWGMVGWGGGEGGGEGGVSSPSYALIVVR